MKKLILFLSLIFGIITSCTYTSNVFKLTTKGIYECTDKLNTNSPIFRFSTESNSTVIYSGINSYIEFKDLYSGKIINTLD